MSLFISTLCIFLLCIELGNKQQLRKNQMSFLLFAAECLTAHWMDWRFSRLTGCAGSVLSLLWILALWMQLPAIFSSVSLSPSLPLCFSQVRKFVAKDSAGLRVRSHPSLQSEQIGIVQVNGTITFIDEVKRSRIGPKCSVFKSFSVFSSFNQWT